MNYLFSISYKFGIIRILMLFIILNIFLLTFPYPSFAADCSKTSIGLSPLTELIGFEYKGERGGLYLNGNEPPEEFNEASMELASLIVPLDQKGDPDNVNGRIVIISVGMSLTWQEFEEFQKLSDSDPFRNPSITIINSAIPGVSASSIADSETDFYWATLNRTLDREGLSVKQVQVVWLKEVNGPGRGFPEDANDLKDDLKKIVQLIKEKYVNVRIVYLSSRSYGGYGGPNLEPYSFETGFAVKWLIEEQISGSSDLNYDSSKGIVVAPILRWGPYLWSNGINHREGDNLSWDCSDFDNDGLHPSSSGQKKAGRLLLNFMQTDPTARVWYLSEDSKDEKIEPLVFERPFPIFWLGTAFLIIIISGYLTFRVVKNRSIADSVGEIS